MEQCILVLLCLSKKTRVVGFPKGLYERVRCAYIVPLAKYDASEYCISSNTDNLLIYCLCLMSLLMLSPGIANTIFLKYFTISSISLNNDGKYLLTRNFSSQYLAYLSRI